jgi:hypothetical protein
MDNVTREFQKISSEILYNKAEKAKQLVEESGAQLSLAARIELSLTGWKGYDGIKIPRDYNNENSWDIQRTLLAMDTLDWKIGPIIASYYERELAIREHIQNLKGIKAWYN